MTSPAPFSRRLGTTPTSPGRSSRKVPSAIASLGPSSPIRPASCPTPSSTKRRAVPADMTHALPSLFTPPSGPSEIRLVSRPSRLAKTVTCSALTPTPNEYGRAARSENYRYSTTFDELPPNTVRVAAMLPYSREATSRGLPPFFI